jgi:hypothetical protein
MTAKATGIVSVSVTTTTGTYKDLADFNFAVDGWTDLLSGPQRTYATGSRPGRLDTALLATPALYKPNELTITGTVCSDSPSYAMSDLIADVQNLKGWCARTVALKVSTLNSAAFLSCSLTGAFVSHFDVPGKQRAAKVSLTFQALDPVWYSTTLTTNAITTSLTQQALGTAPVRPVITFTGAPSGLTLTYADSAGTTVQTLVLAGLTTSGATSLVVDMSAMTIVQTVSGTPASVVSKITSGDFFALDPKDADTVTPTWCKLVYSLSGGSVSAVACAYRKAWY